MRKLLTAIWIIIVFQFTACVNEVDEEPYNFPSIISGQVRNNEGAGLRNAKISLSTAPGFESIFTNDQGFFRLENVPAGRHKIKVELYGYQSFEADIPSAVNGVSTVNPVLQRRTYSVPTIKPLSTGPVRIRNKKLEVDFDRDGTYQPFFIKGVAYSPTPIGNRTYTTAMEDRSIQYLQALNANTIRTYSGAGKVLLQKISQLGIYCIVGFWVNTTLDLSVESNRASIKDQFAAFVTDLKDSPGLLMWTLGNEQNYVNGNNPYWYSLAQELAIIAYQIEGENYHPVSINNGNIYNIGNPSFNADDASLTYIDLWASNIYEYNFTNSINLYKTKSNKPIVFTEFGIDALDDRTKTEYENVQAEHDSLNWQQILTNQDVLLGGTVFEYTDEWWKAGNPFSQDYGGYNTGAHPDGYSNEEWWGLIRVLPDSNGDGMDDWQPRKAYYMFQRNWL